MVPKWCINYITLLALFFGRVIINKVGRSFVCYLLIKFNQQQLVRPQSAFAHS